MTLPDTCNGCGCCCIRATPEMDVLVAVDDRVPETLTVELGGLHWMQRRADGECVALDHAARTCTLYTVRPQGCRELERGSPDCMRALALLPKE